MRIRQATMDDYAGLCAVFAEVDALHVTVLPEIFRHPGGAARPEAYIASIVNDENACLWVAEHNDQIVGLVKVAIRETRDIPVLVPRRYAEIGTLAVAQRHQRRGIGRALMQAAESWASEKGIDQIELSVWEFNDQARAFYAALGYHTASLKMWRRGIGREASTEPDSP